MGWGESLRSGQHSSPGSKLILGLRRGREEQTPEQASGQLEEKPMDRCPTPVVKAQLSTSIESDTEEGLSLRTGTNLIL